jgi:putative tributyrin esterase
MALCELHFRSAALGKQEAMNVIIPDGKGPFPVLYLLHGLSDDYTIWQRRTSIERYVAGLPLIVVMPDGGRSFYCNVSDEARYEDHIVRDVVDVVDRTFKTRCSARSRAIAGSSMGGYGAIMLTLRHPDVFSVAASHSAAIFFGHDDLKDPDRNEYVNKLVRLLPPRKYDCYNLATKLKKKGKMPALRLDCGTKDFLIEHNRNFHAYLNKIRVPHVYEEFPGLHEWDYWDEHICQTLDFVMAKFQKV